MNSTELRRPLLFAALGIAVLIALIELGLGWRSELLGGTSPARPGHGIAYLICIDALLLYSLSLMTVSIFLPREFTGRLQGVIGIVASLLGLLLFVLMFMFALQLLILMVSLLLAPLFGTIAYFALFAEFNRSGAAATLGLLLLLKLGAAGALVLAHPRFIENKSLVVLLALSLGCTFLVGVLLAFPPGFLVSITDMIGAVIAAGIGIIMGGVLLVGSCVAAVKAVV
ncbi:hypothetical protein CR51_36295 [Caballeronia megalochromosomata]|jgi:hypothetical protein|nr:hypothetical protein CR51_36295 [Caballeronia megalochromosomata]